MPPAIRVQNISKKYRLGQTHTGSVRDLVNSAAARLFRRQSTSPSATNPPVEDTSRVDENGDFWALKDVSFEVNPGEVVGIIGRNGAGKSTLLKILSQIVVPTSGRIQINGRIASLLEVGTGFHPELTGRENVYMNGTILGMTKREITRRFDEIIDFAGVEQFVDTPVKRYSSGMTVRLGFAVAAHLDPEILVVDEVLAVGDVEFQRRCLNKMEDAAHSGKTVLFVGGTPLYLKALLRGLCEGPPPDWEFREAIEREVQETGVAALHERLRLVDPLAAAKLHPHDMRRIIRALEVNRLTGRPLSHLQTQFEEMADESQGRVFGLEWPRPELHERIERRVVSMFEQGLVEEVERLCREHSALSRTASQAVGYREVLEFLRGARSLDETIALVQARTRQFARRQETWFRGLTECRRVAMREAEDPSETARRILVGATATDSSSDAL